MIIQQRDFLRESREQGRFSNTGTLGPRCNYNIALEVRPPLGSQAKPPLDVNTSWRLRRALPPCPEGFQLAPRRARAVRSFDVVRVDVDDRDIQSLGDCAKDSRRLPKMGSSPP